MKNSWATPFELITTDLISITCLSFCFEGSIDSTFISLFSKIFEEPTFIHSTSCTVEPLLILDELSSFTDIDFPISAFLIALEIFDSVAIVSKFKSWEIVVPLIKLKTSPPVWESTSVAYIVVEFLTISKFSENRGVWWFPSLFNSKEPSCDIVKSVESELDEMERSVINSPFSAKSLETMLLITVNGIWLLKVSKLKSALSSSPSVNELIGPRTNELLAISVWMAEFGWCVKLDAFEALMVLSTDIWWMVHSNMMELNWQLMFPQPYIWN